MPKRTNLDWKQYEAITKYIYETLGKQSGVIVKGKVADLRSGLTISLFVIFNHLLIFTTKST